LLPAGSTKTKGNFLKATFDAIRNAYGYLSPDLWAPTVHTKSPFQEYTDFLKESQDRDKMALKRAAE
jgi:small subunit ribosomal protein S2e